MLFAQGVCVGIKTVPGFDNGPPKVIAGLAAPKENGFPGESQFQEITLTKRQIAEGYPAKFNALQDQMIVVPLSVRNGVMNDRAWINYSCTGEPKALHATTVAPSTPPAADASKK